MQPQHPPGMAASEIKDFDAFGKLQTIFSPFDGLPLQVVLDPGIDVAPDVGAFLCIPSVCLQGAIQFVFVDDDGRIGEQLETAA